MLRKPLLSLLLGVSVLSSACSDDPKPDPAVLIIDREAVDFGELEVGQTSPEQLFTVRNASPWPVQSVSVKMEGSGFTIAANTCERFLDAGMECEVRVRFSPRLAGPNEAFLRVEGAPEVDSAVLKGMGVGYVVVRSLPGDGSRVVAEGDDWSCSEPCTVSVRKARVTLRALPAGLPTWGGDCAVAAGGDCALTIDGTKVVSLEKLESSLRWEVRLSAQPRSVAVTTDGDILVLEAGQLLRFDATGQLLWSVLVSGGLKMGLDGENTAYVVDFSGRVTRYSRGGLALWTSSESTEARSGHQLAVSASGHAYVLLDLGPGGSLSRLKLIALSPQGTERWSLLLDEGELNFASGLAVSAQGEVYVSASAFNRNVATGESVLVKSYFRKYSVEGALQWETQDNWGLFAVNAEGATSTLLPDYMPTGGFTHYWIGANGNFQWSETIASGPGVVSLLTFTSPSSLLIGGYELLQGGVQGRGWFSAMDVTARTPGPVIYVEDSVGVAGPVHIRGLARTPAGHAVVIGATSQSYNEGYIWLFDARMLTGVP
ncbi:PQQ-binding-like beta-propeller repeat protein [Myxococcus sp. 1LA]